MVALDRSLVHGAMKLSVDKEVREANGVENKAAWDATDNVESVRRWDKILLGAG